MARQSGTPILLLVGPPGTGKTSLASSVARSLGRKFTRVSLGGVRDEADIRGHRRTYVGAMPGLIVQALRRVRCNNPVLLLDEIDKLSRDGLRGDPAAAMLEVLDPEQNGAFVDHYLGPEAPVDLSNVLFMATANSLDTISAPLLDRMEVVELAGYTFEEKLHIAQQHLLPKQIAANALGPNQVRLSDEQILAVASGWTREAGVRGLERQLASICRAKAVDLARLQDAGRTEEYRAGVDDVETILGAPIFEPEMAARVMRPGVVTGLAYMGSGNGGLLFLEAAAMPAEHIENAGQLILTGRLGKVIQESAMLALSLVRSHAEMLGLGEAALFRGRNIHIHAPAGAVPKDGPSAGVAMVVALMSMVLETAVDPHIAMTGEVTLRGRVLPVGGIREKVLAAHRAGISKVILPARNLRNVEADVPNDVRARLAFVYVDDVWQALDETIAGHAFQDHVNQGQSPRASPKQEHRSRL